MATRETVWDWRTTYDGSGSQQMIRDTNQIAGATQRTTAALKTEEQAVLQVDVSKRRLMSSTQMTTASLLAFGSGTGGAAAGMQALGSAVGFMGHTLGGIAGPLSLIILLASAVGEGFLRFGEHAEKASDKAERLSKQLEDVKHEIEELDASEKLADRFAVERLVTLEREIDAQKRLAEALATVDRARDKVGTALKHLSDLQAEQVLESDAYNESLKAFRDEGVSTVELTEKWTKRQVELSKAIEGTRGEVKRLSEQQGELMRATHGVVEQNKDGIISLLGFRRATFDNELETAKLGQVFKDQLDISKTVWKEVTKTAKDEATIQRLVAIQTAQEIYDAQVELEKKQAALRVKAFHDFESIEASLVTVVEKSGQASFKTIKDLKYAEAIVNTAAGVAMALSGSVPPFNFIAAAAVAAAGAAQIATIASTTPSGGGSVQSPSGSSPSGSITTAGPTTTGSAPTSGPTAAGSSGVGTMNVYFENITFEALDPESIPARRLRQFVHRFAELLSEEMNGLGNSFRR